VLAGLGRCRNADDLARAALEDQKVADADVVARNGDSVGAALTLDETNIATGWCTILVNCDLLANFGGTTVVMVVVPTAEGVHDFIRSTLQTAAEAVVLTLVVVVTHLLFVLNGSLVDNDLGGMIGLGVVNRVAFSALALAGVLYVVCRVLLKVNTTTSGRCVALVLDVVGGVVVPFVGRLGALAVASLGNVELIVLNVLAIVDYFLAKVVSVSTAGITLNVDLNVCAAVGLLLGAVSALTSDLYLRSETVTFFVDADLFLAARTVFLGYVGLEGSVTILPSDALLGDLCLDLGVLFDALFRTLVLVAGWEDAEGDWYLGVKVQVADFACERDL